ncbi:hypothetical protein CEXT_87461 [Caerostris extrusa]|uniref:Uncharacterized protein n=1 Tax=Caerostris extrusa TaxID=172846 RepID=A0AAV4Y2N6_CAEEX|nr:hypothetical protein CEXT_87461 [Caerostris extrusa]
MYRNLTLTPFCRALSKASLCKPVQGKTLTCLKECKRMDLLAICVPIPPALPNDHKETEGNGNSMQAASKLKLPACPILSFYFFLFFILTPM